MVGNNRKAMLGDAELPFHRRGPYRMGMPAQYKKWTVELLDALPESNDRFELIDGELFVTPSPGYPHQSVVSRLAAQIVPYVIDVGECEAIVSPSDLWR